MPATNDTLYDTMLQRATAAPPDPTGFGYDAQPAKQHRRYQALMGYLPQGGDAQDYLRTLDPNNPAWIQSFQQWAVGKNQPVQDALGRINHQPLGAALSPTDFGVRQPVNDSEQRQLPSTQDFGPAQPGSGGDEGVSPTDFGKDAQPLTPTQQWGQMIAQKTKPAVPASTSTIGFDQPVSILTPEGIVEQVNPIFVPYLLSRGARLASRS